MQRRHRSRRVGSLALSAVDEGIERELLRSWGGIASLQLELVRGVDRRESARSRIAERIADWMCAAHGAPRRARATEGAASPKATTPTLSIWNPDASFVVDPPLLMHRHHLTPYAGRELFGVVRSDVCRRSHGLRRRQRASPPISPERRLGIDFTDLIDLASERLGGAVLAANDEFFAPKEALHQAVAARMARRRVHRARQVDGRVGDSPSPHARRHDWAIIRLGAPGIVRGVVIDTSVLHRQLSGVARAIEWCAMDGTPSVGDSRRGRMCSGAQLLPTSKLRRQREERACDSRTARIASRTCASTSFPTAVWRGCACTVTSFPTSASSAPIAKSRSRRDGEWRLRRRVQRHALRPSPESHSSRSLDAHGRRLGDEAPSRPRHDWSIVRLARRGTIERVELDTDHFKGNAPGSVHARVRGRRHDRPRCAIRRRGAAMAPARSETPLQPHARHRFSAKSRRATAPTCASTSIPTAAWRGCGCSVR